MTAQSPTLKQEIAAAMDWWRDAGVDLHFADDATDWLAPLEVETSPDAAATQAEVPTAAEKPASAEKIDLLGSDPPRDIETFREWWLTAPGLDPIGPRGRVPPRGEAKAKLMVLVTDPEEGDRDILLSGPQGQLLARMLSAMGFAEDQVYLASALPRHMPLTEGTALAEAGYGEVLMHHISLAEPEKIIALGANILPLFGHNAAQEANSLREINHDGRITPLLVSEGLDSLMAMPRLKARFWRRWLEWTDG